VAPKENKGMTGHDERTSTKALESATLSVSLTVKDLEHSLAWYRDIVGFSVHQTFERQGKVMAVSLRAGHVRILISRDDEAKGVDRVKGAGFSMMITVDESIDEMAGRIKEAGGLLDSEPVDTPWGPRMFRLRDPDGFRYTISSNPASS
jgi:uncharacterized glyoxalase superfamily protein PhnB